MTSLRSGCILFVVTALLTAAPAHAQHFWQNTTVTSPAEIDDSPAGAFYYHNGATVYKSINHGASWDSVWVTPVSRINRVQYASDGTGFVATEGSGLYRTDKDLVFAHITTGVSTEKVRPIAFGAPAEVYVGTYDNYVFRSTDNGNTWTHCLAGLTDNNVSSLVVASNGDVYAGVKGSNGLFKSTDHGASWTQTAMTTSARVMTLAVTSSGTIIALTGEDYPDGIYRSTNNGSSWTRVAAAGVAMSEFPPVVTGTTIYAAGERTGVYRSTDDGATWETLNDGLSVTGVPNTGAISLAMHGGYLWVSTHYGIFRSVNTVLGVNEPSLPSGFTLAQNFPNPFNPSTLIRYSLKSLASVNLAVFDLLGRQIAVLVDGKQITGDHEVVFDGSDLSSGVYYYRLTINGVPATRSMLLTR